MAEALSARFASIAHIGGAATSDVCLAKRVGEDTADPEIVVIKRLKLGADAEKRVTAVFNAEASLALRLHHPNIVHAREAGEDDDGPFLVLDYVDGLTLARIRSRAQRRAGGVPRAVALRIVREAAGALAYAHELKDENGKSLKIVHRDASPENILVTYDGAVQLLDFGVALAAVPTEARGGVMKGSVAYLAPEQARAGVAVDARADVFALGVVLWELLAGKRLWEGMSEGDVLARLADADVPAPSVRMVVPDVPTELDAICAQALAKVRDDRYESALELCEALDKAKADLGLEATQEDVASFVATLFEDERDKMRGVIEAARARPATETPQSVPRLSVPPPTGSGALVDHASEPALPVGTPSRPNLPVSATQSGPVEVVEILRVEQAPSPDRRFAYAMTAAVLMVFAVVAGVIVTYKPPPPPPEVILPRHTAAPDPPPSAAEPPPTASAEPEEITVEISATPTKAVIYVDGVKAPDNPHRLTVVPGRFQHELRVEAEGFLPTSRTLAFDRERTIEIALMPKPATGPITPPRPQPATPVSVPSDLAPPKAIDPPKSSGP